MNRMDELTALHRDAKRTSDHAAAGRHETEAAKLLAENLPEWMLRELADKPSDALRNRAARLALATLPVRERCGGEL